MRLQSKTILLTGATSGIGRNLVDRLPPSNRIIAVGRDGDRAATLRRLCPDLTFIACDLAVRADVNALAANVLASSPIDGFIHCAAVQNTSHLTDPAFDLDATYDEVSTNFTAFVHLTAMLLPTLVAREETFVLAVNSGLGLVPKRSSAVYCATKGALDIFCQSLRAQLRDTPVAVMQAFLPLVDTPMTEGRGTGKLSPDDAAARIIDGIERGVADHDIGKVKLLRALRRASPSFARRIMEQE
ncbi:SDR family NAD(P)-dependent oxidoreductase [Rhizobiaceae bacterium]|nr:SDR family NAD(P)-dependent oxidoreductase [Rhizobiaceae bacterium]